MGHVDVFNPGLHIAVGREFAVGRKVEKRPWCPTDWVNEGEEVS